MNENKNKPLHNTLLLAVDEQNGIVGEYQRTLYEATILGIDRVVVCSFFDRNSKRTRKDSLIAKLKMTCKILNMDLLPIVFVPNPQLFNTKVIKTTESGVFLGDFSNYPDYQDYVISNMGQNIISQRERLGPILINKMVKRRRKNEN